MRRRAVPRGESGFTLIEIVMAMLMLSVAVLGMASIMVGTSRRHEQSVSHGELTAAAEGKFEHLRMAAAAGSADTVQLGIGGSLAENTTDHADSLVTEHGRWIRRRWVVADGPAGTRAVTLRVVPDESAANDHDAIDFDSLVLVQ